MSLRAYAGDMSKVLAARIKALRLSKKMTQAQFAELFGVTQAMVSRWETGATPGGEILAQLAAMTGESVQSFVGFSSSPALRPAGELIEVRGSVVAGVWREAWEWDADERYFFSSAVKLAVPPGDRFGLRVDGLSMDQLYPEGTILDCVSLIAIGEAPVVGKRYIVQRVCHDGTLETTVKEYSLGADGRAWLLPRSSQPEFQAPIPVHDGDPRITETRILAKVVGSYRPE